MSALEDPLISIRAAAVAVSLQRQRAPWVPSEDDLDWVPCCEASAYQGAEFCTCWEPIFDSDQAEATTGQVPLQVDLCMDCAYRRDSPERAAGESEFLEDLPQSGRPFVCHQGMRRVVRWRHPDGREVPADPKDYQPAFNADGHPVRADGTPAALCAGWLFRRITALRAQEAGMADDVLTASETIRASAVGRGCLGRSADDEPVFVICGRDPVAGDVLREWADRREVRAHRLGLLDLQEKNKIAGARRAAAAMDAWSTTSNVEMAPRHREDTVEGHEGAVEDANATDKPVEQAEGTGNAPQTDATDGAGAESPQSAE